MDNEISTLEAEVNSTKNMVGHPYTTTTASAMSDQTKIYVYTGTETGYTAGHWYYYNGTAWTDGGVYNSVAVNTDTSLTVSGQAADSKAVGDAIDDLDSDLSGVKETLNNKYEKPSTGIPASDLASGVIPDVSGKADKISGATSGNFASLDANGNLADSGKKPSDFLTEHQDLTDYVRNDDYVTLTRSVDYLKSDLRQLDTATPSDVNKVLSPKSIENGKVVEWQFLEGASPSTAQIVTAVDEWFQNNPYDNPYTSLALNVSNFVNGDLTSANLPYAVSSALAVGSYLFIPGGDYCCNIEINSDCVLFLDKNCYLSTDNENPAITATGCSISIIGGNFYAGENDGSREYVYDGTDVHGIIYLDGCTNSTIANIKVPHSKYGAAIMLEDTVNVTIENCDLNHVLNTGIFIYQHNVNTIIRNCRIQNITYSFERYYCYAIAASSGDNVIPHDGFTVENCYIYNGEDSGIDTHGGTNIYIRNNIVLETVCAITAYNDNRRVVRPSGWIMRNVIIENNYCESSKSNNPLARWRHPFGFVGSPNTLSTEDDETETGNVGNFYEFVGCIVRNNYFKSSNDYGTLFSLNSCSRKVMLVNNTFDCCNSGSRAFYLNRSIDVIIENNAILNTDVQIVARQSVGRVSGNIGLKLAHSLNTLTYLDGMDGSLQGYGKTQCVKYGDVIYGEDGMPKVCNSYGLRVREIRCPDAVKSFNITIANGVATMSDNFLIPGIALQIKTTEGAHVTYGYVTDVIDFIRFAIKKNDGTDIPDGTYVAYLRFATFSATGVGMYSGTVTASVNVRATASDTGAVIATLAKDSPILFDAGTNIDDNNNVISSYTHIFFVNNGVLTSGYVISTRVHGL